MDTLRMTNYIIAVVFFVCYTYQFLYIPVPWLLAKRKAAKAAALEKAEERIQALEKALKDCQARSIQAELVCAAADLLQRAVEGLKTQQA